MTPNQTREQNSRKVYQTESRDFWITVAGWAPLGAEFGESFEIGIRQKIEPYQFWLVQNSWREQGAIKAAGAIVMMLNNGYAPTEINLEVFP